MTNYSKKNDVKKDFVIDEKYSQSKCMAPSFFRSTNEFNNEEVDQKFSIMIGGTPVTNFEQEIKFKELIISL